MPALIPTPRYHDRIDLGAYDTFFSDIPEREFSHHDVTSPFDAWSIEQLRAKLGPQKIEKVPTDILVWGRGEPKHVAGTKIGGVPAWPLGEPLPCARKKCDLFKTQVRFFGQFNFMDSLDLVPELPGGLLSVWAASEFPWKPGSIRTFWLNPADASPAAVPAPEVGFEGLPATPFYAALHRTWDPAPDQQIVPVAVDHQFEAYRNYRPHALTASKIGGLEAMPQRGSDPTDRQFLLQFRSIQAAPEVPFPWINREEPLSLGFSENSIHHEQNCLVLGDMGAISFCVHPGGRVKATFECG